VKNKDKTVRSELQTTTAGNMYNDNKNRFDIVNGKQLTLLIAPLICFLAAAAAVAARWYTRSVRRINTPAEDALMLAGLVRCDSLRIAPNRAMLTHNP